MTGATGPTGAGIGAQRNSVLKNAIAANIGAVFEWYDLLLYALFAVTLSKQFFPPGDPNSAVLLSLGTFAVARLVRPVGAVVMYCGHYATVPALLSDLFHTRRRTTGISIAYVLGRLLFGGVTPLVVGWIVVRTGDPASRGSI